MRGWKSTKTLMHRPGADENVVVTVYMYYAESGEKGNRQDRGEEGTGDEACEMTPRG